MRNIGTYETKGEIVFSRFGDPYPIPQVDVQKEYRLEEKVETCQWAVMDFCSGSTLAPHIHKKKDEFFYFSGLVDIDVDIKDLANPDYSRREGFISIKSFTAHSMQANYGDVWFHSLNMPDIINDSRRL